MTRIAIAAFLCISALGPTRALAGDVTSSACTDLSLPKSAIEAHHGKWIELTSEQWQFLRGVYALHPNTPRGLPFGDKAVLAQVAGDTGGLIFFIDGELACTPMPIPGELIAMVRDVGAANIIHEAGGL